jgi:hypothetical protein
MADPWPRSCTGFAAEIMNFVYPFTDVAKYNVRMGVIVGDDFCPGIPENVLNVVRAAKARGGGAAAVAGAERPRSQIKKFRSEPIADWDIDVFISHKPADDYPTWPYTGLVTIKNRPKSARRPLTAAALPALTVRVARTCSAQVRGRAVHVGGEQDPQEVVARAAACQRDLGAIACPTRGALRGSRVCCACRSGPR